MDLLAGKLINDHRNPIVKADLPGSKLFLRSGTEDEASFTEKHQNNLKDILSHERAERRCARSSAVWSFEGKLAKIIKMMKSSSHFGYQDKNGTYLYPEETLFLMETNRLEVILNEIPMSVQEGYDILLKNCECDIIKYKVYKKLSLLGYRLVRYAELMRRLSKTSTQSDTVPDRTEDKCHKKRSVEGDEDDKSPRKKLKVPSNNQVISNVDVGSLKNQPQLEKIKDLFEKLRKASPKEYKAASFNEVVPDYCVFLPNNKNRCSYDCGLYICKNKESILSRGQSNESVPSIYAICSEGNISFYKYATVTLPLL